MTDHNKQLRPDQAPGDIKVSAIAQFTIALVVIIVVFSGLMWWLSGFLRGLEAAKDPAPPVLREARQPAEPQGPALQTDPFSEMAALRDQEQDILETYAWENQTAGITRIPIERAMELLAAHAEQAALPEGGADE